MARHERFVGEICGFGTSSGVRIVIGHWERSPLGSFADAMVEHGDGRRVLVAPSHEVAAYVGSIYQFDDVVESPVVVRREPDSLTFRGGPLQADVAIGRRSALGQLLRRVPRVIAAGRIWPVLADPVVRLVMPGVRARGVTPGGREAYSATDLHVVDAVTASWGGDDLGPLAPLEPPVRFGFSSAPRRPAIVTVTTTVRRTETEPAGATS